MRETLSRSQQRWEARALVGRQRADLGGALSRSQLGTSCVARQQRAVEERPAYTSPWRVVTLTPSAAQQVSIPILAQKDNAMCSAPLSAVMMRYCTVGVSEFLVQLLHPL
ncbi:hypothetical protein GOP47_0012801 [Adiantum capillus-veneris]|uniref:Uncharacterized protein n=1 Tax=Adiantum capillus-veneris TaxID=13818 RepID=A0A9D4URR7_ADICA|nr:hypothetical protein GOP47_0012801 [Adiantum capillus-veneris]